MAPCFAKSSSGRRSLALLATVLVSVLGTMPAGAEPPEPWVEASRAGAARFGGRLMQELTTALAVSPVEAIAVCKERAPRIALEEGALLGADIGRTAIRLRNHANTPDGWQQRALESFATAIAAGADPATLEHIEVVEDSGVRERRWMKPIMLAPMCVACHGKTLAPEVAQAVTEAYPSDAATGFAPGDLRGAFYVVWREMPAL